MKFVKINISMWEKKQHRHAGYTETMHDTQESQNQLLLSCNYCFFFSFFEHGKSVEVRHEVYEDVEM